MTGPLIIAAIGMVIGAFALSAATWRSAAAYITCLILVGVALLYEAGHARPVWTLWEPIGKATLVGAVLDEPTAIFIWVVPNGTATPVAYKLPWDEKTAEQLTKAQKEAGEKHVPVGVSMKKKGHGSGAHMAGKKMFYPEPQLPYPPKAPR